VFPSPVLACNLSLCHRQAPQQIHYIKQNKQTQWS
jgi:hypothetical protein